MITAIASFLFANDMALVIISHALWRFATECEAVQKRISTLKTVNTLAGRSCCFKKKGFKVLTGDKNMEWERNLKAAGIFQKTVNNSLEVLGVAVQAKESKFLSGDELVKREVDR